jgi:hypothetical protein
MNRDRSPRLVVVEVRWEEKRRNGSLWRKLFDLLLRDPDPRPSLSMRGLSDSDTPLTTRPDVLTDKEEGER